MPWLLVIKNVLGGVFKLIPLKVWAVIIFVVAAYFSIKHYGNTQYAEGVYNTQQEYKKAEEKALNEDLRKVKEELKVAIAYKEKMDQKASQVAAEVEKYAEHNRELNKRIDELKSKDIACRDIDIEYQRLFESIFKENSSK